MSEAGFIETYVLLATFDNAETNETFEKYITLPDTMNYDDVWKVALGLALEFENSADDFLLRGLVYLGYGITR